MYKHTGVIKLILMVHHCFGVQDIINLGSGAFGQTLNAASGVKSEKVRGIAKVFIVHRLGNIKCLY